MPVCTAAATFYGDLASAAAAEVELKDISADVLEQLLLCIYTDECERDALVHMPEALLQAGDRFAVERLARCAEQELARTLTVDNVCSRLLLSDAHNQWASYLKDACIELMCLRFNEVQQTEGYRQLLQVPHCGMLLSEILQLMHARVASPRRSYSELLETGEGVKELRIGELRSELLWQGLDASGTSEVLAARLIDHLNLADAPEK